ncbi:MAG: L-rhamnose isomerase [Bryobacteraceae bacterium]
MANNQTIHRAFELARERYAELGVDAEAAMKALRTIPVSLHCWQGDDVGGFETAGAGLTGGGIQATGNYPGKARSIDELRRDIEMALALVPGRHRLNLHASYLDNGGRPVARNEIEPRHFQSWIDWAKTNGLGLDFNPTYFSHPLANDGFTLTHADPAIRNFWVEHGIACREIGAEMGRQLGSPAVVNVWIPDGYKDIPIDRTGPRERLTDSLDRMFAKPLDERHVLDAVEAKLFGIGLESYTAGSAEFYLAYAVSRHKLLCLDAGHYHPTETISEKISTVLMFCPGLLLHVSRPVRWDSDHVVILDDELQAIAREVARSRKRERIHLGLDYFDASINRVAAWVIGTRNLLKALLIALLEPTSLLENAEAALDFTRRLALFEESKSLPWAAVWDYYCATEDVPAGTGWFGRIEQYERDVQSKRTGN